MATDKQVTDQETGRLMGETYEQSLSRLSMMHGGALGDKMGIELTEVSARLDDPPILLLDDVPSELDPGRRALLFETITRLDCQTLISVTEREIVPVRTDRLDFQVRAGRITGVS